MKEVKLVLATKEETAALLELQYKAFLPLYEKYHDDETNPVKDTFSKIQKKIVNEHSEFYIIRADGNEVGGVYVKRKTCKNTQNQTEIISDVNLISPLFILPEYQNQGIGQNVLQQLFNNYPDTIEWILYTIKEEKRNCHLYEKCGFVQTGDEKVVNEKMTLVRYERSMVCVRKFKNEDAMEVKNLMCRNFIEVNVKDYGKKAMEFLARSYKEEKVIQIASSAHMYVFEWHDKIVAVGSIASFWGSPTESILLTIFVLPDLHGKGIGRKIITTLESDELFLRADRIEIPASITATEFYRKFGYDYKDNVKERDQEGHYRLEKFRYATNDTRRGN